jgi:PKD repeat protein
MSVSAVRAVATRKTWCAALLVALALTGALVPRAGAALVHIAGGRVAGVLPARGVTPASIPGSFARRNAASSTTTPDNGTLNYSGGPVLHAEMPYLIFWDPSNQISAADRALYVRFFADSSADSGMATNVYAVDRQFTDATGFANYSQTWTAAHALVDTQAFPISQCPVGSGQTACLTDTQLTDELTRLIGASGLPTGVTGSAPIYFIVTPDTVNSCFDASGGTCADTNPGYCAYHSSFMDGPSNVLYADIPILPAAADPKSCQADQYSTVQSPNADQTADVVIKYMSHEYNETITDPLGNAWYEIASGQENGDNCNIYSPTPDPARGTNPNAFNPTLGGSASLGTLYDQLMNGNRYYTQSEWSNGDADCKMQPTSKALSPAFSAPPAAAPDTAVAFDPSASSPSSGYTSTTWNFGDGTTMFTTSKTPAVATHYFRSNGTFTVTLTLVDAYGNLFTVSRTITISGVGAYFTYPTPPPPQANTAVTFDGHSSVDSYASITTYTWSFDAGSPVSTGNSPTVQHTFVTAGSHTVKLTVSDGTRSASWQESVLLDAPPSPAFTVTTASPVAGTPVAFDGSGSSETNGSIASYSWDFGDGSPLGIGPTPSHSYGSAGTYPVTLTVTDQDGYTAQSTRAIVVDSPPTPAFSVSAAPRAGSAVSFDASASNEPGGSIAAYSWNFGDGSAARGASTTHTYATAGTYTVTLTVTDAKGRAAAASQAVTVAAALAPPPAPPPGPPPTTGSPTAAISVTTTHPIAGGIVGFSGSRSSDRSATLVAYSWAFGDGSSATGVTPGHRYRRPGGYTVTVTVRDAAGATATTSRRVTVGSAGISGVKIKTGKKVEQLTLSISGPGRLTTGKLRFQVKRAESLVIKVPLTRAQASRVISHRALTIRLVFRFTPSVGARSTSTVKFRVGG